MLFSDASGIRKYVHKNDDDTELRGALKISIEIHSRERKGESRGDKIEGRMYSWYSRASNFRYVMSVIT